MQTTHGTRLTTHEKTAYGVGAKPSGMRDESASWRRRVKKIGAGCQVLGKTLDSFSTLKAQCTTIIAEGMEQNNQ